MATQVVVIRESDGLIADIPVTVVSTDNGVTSRGWSDFGTFVLQKTIQEVAPPAKDLTYAY